MINASFGRIKFEFERKKLPIGFSYFKIDGKFLKSFTTHQLNIVG